MFNSWRGLYKKRKFLKLRYGDVFKRVFQYYEVCVIPAQYKRILNLHKKTV